MKKLKEDPKSWGGHLRRKYDKHVEDVFEKLPPASPAMKKMAEAGGEAMSIVKNLHDGLNSAKEAAFSNPYPDFPVSEFEDEDG